jgi:hypothetical protein
MKKIGFVIVASLIVLLSGCKVEKNEQKNGKGASAAAYWLDATEEVLMRGPDIAFKFNAWLTAPTGKKDSIKDLYFPDYDIQKTQATVWWFLLNGHRIFGINTGGSSLNNPDVSWIVGWDTNAYSSNSFHSTYLTGCSMMLGRLNNGNDWKIYAQPSWAEHPDFPWNSVLTLTFSDNSVPATLTGRDFSLSGEGNYHFYAMKNQGKDVYYCQSFKIEDAQIQDFKGMDSRNLWTSGNLSLQIIADWDTVPANYMEEENFKARFFAKDGRQHAIITMHDVEEDWILPEPQSMEGQGQESSLIDWLFPWF